MPLSLSLRLEGDDALAEGASPRPRAAPPSLSFDGPEIVLGRANGADVPIPDLEVAPRHATILRDGASYALRDDGGALGTFVGGVRVRSGGTRLLASGDVIRIGRVELRVTVDVTMPPGAGSTREMALEVLSKLIRADDDETRVRIVEGRRRGKALVLAEVGRRYVLGRETTADLQIMDELASREHVELTREGDDVLVRDLGAKNSAVLGGTRLMANRAVVWHPFTHLRIGAIVLALEIPRRNVVSVLEQLPESARFDASASPAQSVGTDGAVDDDARVAPAQAPSVAPAAPSPPAAAASAEVRDSASMGAGQSPQATAATAPLAGAPSAVTSAPTLPAEASRPTGLGVNEKAIVVVVATILVLCIAGLVWIVTARG